MAKLAFGGAIPSFSPIEVALAAAQAYEAAGLDYLWAGDQLNATIPRSILTPDIVPASAAVDLDEWMDTFVVMTAVAMVTEAVGIWSFCDAVRRNPVSLAQLTMSLDQVSHGRFGLALGAGEAKQFGPYGLPRVRPFGQLEEAVKLVKMLMATNEQISYEGPVYSLRSAVLANRPYNAEAPPPVIVMGGPGRAVAIAGRHADGWMTYLPPCGEPEWYAEQVQSVRQQAERAGRDPDRLVFMVGASCLVHHDEDVVDDLCRNPALRWDTAAFLPSTDQWARWGSATNPLGPDFHYARDYANPFEWGREQVLAVAEQVPPEIVRRSKFSGTPKQAAALIQPYVEAGATHVSAGNYADLVLTGDWGDQASGTNALLEMFDELRALNGGPEASPAKVPA